MSRVLDLQGLCMYFGGLKAVDKLDLFLEEKEIVALIGPNGAGKTTVFNAITGIYQPTHGTVNFLEAHKLGKIPSEKITALGMARTFQNIRLFPDMTVIENVMVARHCRTTTSWFRAVFRPPSTRREEKATLEAAHKWLRFVDLDENANSLAKNLPYGDQRRLEIARALATEPKLLLLDEPAAGMNDKETMDLVALIHKIRELGTTTLLIEHHMKLVMAIAERIYVIDHGVKIAEGTPSEVQKNPKVIAAYLGEEVPDEVPADA